MVHDIGLKQRRTQKPRKYTQLNWAIKKHFIIVILIVKNALHPIRVTYTFKMIIAVIKRLLRSGSRRQLPSAASSF